MLDQNTISKLHEMKLSAMAESFRSQLGDSAYHELDFEERFGLIVDGEYMRRKSNHIGLLVKRAELHFPNAAIEDIEYHPDRKLEKTQMIRLSSCNYIVEKHNLIILGASGSGKTYLCCAFGIAACRNLYTVKYVRLPDLLNEIAVARGEGIYQKVLKQYKKVRLLILDEWLLIPLKEYEARDLLEIIESRHEAGSTIFCSQFTPPGWHAKIGEATLADAILDRIVHNSYQIVIEGKESMRKRRGISEDKKHEQ